MTAGQLLDRGHVLHVAPRTGTNNLAPFLIRGSRQHQVLEFVGIVALLIMAGVL